MIYIYDAATAPSKHPNSNATFSNKVAIGKTFIQHASTVVQITLCNRYKEYNTLPKKLNTLDFVLKNKMHNRIDNEDIAAK